MVVLDFTTGTMSAGSWDEAGTRLVAGDLALTPSPVPTGGSSQLIVPVVVGDRTLRALLDTGAPRSCLFVPRGADLVDGLTRVSTRAMAVQAGEVSANVRFELIERLAPLEPLDSPQEPQPDGILGMDILRTCILAFDKQQFVVRCASGPSAKPAVKANDSGPLAMTPIALSAIRKAARRDSVVQVGADGAVMQRRANGEFEWTGKHVAARIQADGRLSFSRVVMNGPVEHTQMDDHQERRWFEEQVGDLLITLARSHDRALIMDALAALPRHLSAILGDARFSLAERRRLLFLLWDEMAEPEDAERGWAGARARGIIDAFIKRRLPAGAAAAYSSAELAAFNRARGNARRFNPYAPSRHDHHRDRGD